ncbi:MAG: DDE endonuclease [Chloroflexi bacterium RBG_16_50_9]|nr:MAG: DDE endonuclease [Chloroflexi bacterium RBG_16_50_9]
MRTSKRLLMSNTDRDTLERIARNGNTPQKLALRARIALMSADGIATGEIIRRLGTSTPTVTRWRNRYEIAGIPSLLKDRSRPGRKKRIEGNRVREVVEKTLQEKPIQATHWSTRSLAAAVGLSPATVQRIWKEHGLKPHLVRSFKLSRDPRFIEKLHDVVGLYLNPPEHALVFSVDEKSQIQALDRTQPGLPMKRGRAETVTHDYKRNGTTTLFAALNTLDGKVIGQCLPRHRHQEFLRFLRTINRHTPKGLDIHLILDNYATHNHPVVKEWLPKHPHYFFHFVPTSSPWLNMVERWLSQITQKRIRRGVFPSVPDLITAITEYIELTNYNPKPFVWTATVEAILAKLNVLTKC